MKTPREILLKRHESAQTRLDQLRHSVIADLSRSAVEPRISLAVKLWRELIWPCRRIWAGLAATWLLLAMISLLQSGHEARLADSPAASSADVRLALKEQRRVLDEIIGPPPTPISPVASPSQGNVLQPRSARRPEFLLT